MAANVGTVTMVVDVKPARAVKAEALREAAADLYGDDGPGHHLSVGTWLRDRADRLEAGR